MAGPKQDHMRDEGFTASTMRALRNRCITGAGVATCDRREGSCLHQVCFWKVSRSEIWGCTVCSRLIGFCVPSRCGCGSPAGTGQASHMAASIARCPCVPGILFHPSLAPDQAAGPLEKSRRQHWQHRDMGVRTGTLTLTHACSRLSVVLRVGALVV
ncbi:hypothetical protein PMIN01_03325 [Paraphaeosphaeria minitans]|uniref:Uncharacterized protein n=1 Tax=Paraphaeosphaeria minitans TaxID=565426 RepID=A0A9P6GLV7_9PLEO|nr:hypothetical protein PMIN01_03325 [Paraphaeosphaeria minitans]